MVSSSGLDTQLKSHVENGRKRAQAVADGSAAYFDASDSGVVGLTMVALVVGLAG